MTGRTEIGRFGIWRSASLVTPEIAGTALVELVQADVATLEPAYLLTGTGLQPLP